MLFVGLLVAIACWGVLIPLLFGFVVCAWFVVVIICVATMVGVWMFILLWGVFNWSRVFV